MRSLALLLAIIFFALAPQAKALTCSDLSMRGLTDEKEAQILAAAHLQEYNRYHMDVASDLCSDPIDSKDIDG